MTEDPIIIAWAAGLFDGEGSIAVTESTVRVTIEMTDLDVLERMQLYFGGYLNEQVKREAHWKTSWKWYLSNTVHAKEFLKLIYPLLSKRRQSKAEEAFRASPKPRKQAISYIKVYELRDQGLTHKAISDIIGVDRSYVSTPIKEEKC